MADGVVLSVRPSQSRTKQTAKRGWQLLFWRGGGRNWGGHFFEGTPKKRGSSFWFSCATAIYGVPPNKTPFNFPGQSIMRAIQHQVKVPCNCPLPDGVGCILPGGPTKQKGCGGWNPLNNWKAPLLAPPPAPGPSQIYVSYNPFEARCGETQEGGGSDLNGG